MRYLKLYRKILLHVVQHNHYPNPQHILLCPRPLHHPLLLSLHLPLYHRLLFHPSLPLHYPLVPHLLVASAVSVMVCCITNLSLSFHACPTKPTVSLIEDDDDSDSMILDESSSSLQSVNYAAKRRKLQIPDAELSDMFDAFQQQTSVQEADSRSSIQQEAEKWLRRSPQQGLIAAGITPEHVSEPDTILHFWRKSELEFTGLARWARLVFSIPATSAAVERMWHRAKLMVTPLRHALHPDLVRDEIFVAINEKQLL